MKKTSTTNNVLVKLMENSAMVNGIFTEQNKTIDFVKIAAKKKN